jgi:hypothetical protein
MTPTKTKTYSQHRIDKMAALRERLKNPSLPGKRYWVLVTGHWVVCRANRQQATGNRRQAAGDGRRAALQIPPSIGQATGGITNAAKQRYKGFLLMRGIAPNPGQSQLTNNLNIIVFFQ